MRPAPPVPLPGVGDWFASLENFRHHISRTAESNQFKLKLFRSPGTPAGSCELRCTSAGADSHAKQVFCTYRCRADLQPDGSFIVMERDDSHSCPKHAASRTAAAQETTSLQHASTPSSREKRKARLYGSDEYEPEPSSSDEEQYKTRSTRSRRKPDLFSPYLPNPDEQKKADALLMAVENGKYPKKAELLSEAVALARSRPILLPSPEQPFDSVYDLLVLLHAFFEQNPLRPFRRDRRGRISISCSETKKTGCPVGFEVYEGPDEKWRLTKQIFQHAPSCSSHRVGQSTPSSAVGSIQSKPVLPVPGRVASPLPSSLSPAYNGQNRTIQPLSSSIISATPISESVFPHLSPALLPPSPSSALSSAKRRRLHTPLAPPPEYTPLFPLNTPPSFFLPTHLAALLAVSGPHLPPPQAKKHSTRVFQAGISSVDSLVTFSDLEDSSFDAFVELLVRIEPRLAANEADELVETLQGVRRAWTTSD